MRTFLLLITITFAFPIQAAQTEDRVASLERIVLDLSSRVLELEKQLASHPAPIISSVPAGKEAWRKLQKNMNKDQVRALLGEPENINNFGIFEHWNYNNHSRVEFGHNSLVKGWHEPE